MLSRLFRQNLINKRYTLLLILSIAFIVFSFLILLDQRLNIGVESYLDEIFISLSILFIVFLLYIFLKLIIPFILKVRKKNVGTFNSKFTLYFIGIAITPAIIVGALALVIINLGINDWFNQRIQDVIENSVFVAEGYLEEHKKTIKGDIYAMSSDLNKQSDLYLKNSKRFSQILFTQSLIRNLPEAYLIDGSGNLLMKNRQSINIYYRPTSDQLLNVSKGELALFTSTELNKVYALIKLDNFLETYLYVGRPMDNRVLTALKDTRSAKNTYLELEQNRSKLTLIFILIYLIITMILIFVSILIGIRFAKRIVDPITNIIDATDNISKGNYNLKISKNNDFVELNKLTDSFNKMSEDLISQKNQIIINEKHDAWSDIARKIAHEIKNPLTPIQLSTDRLNSKLNNINDINIEEAKICIETINRQVDEIKTLVDEFSNFARMPKPNFINENVLDILNSSISLYKNNYQNIEFKKSIKTDDININCDKSQISRVFNNLIINSIFAINENDGLIDGLIEIEIKRIDNMMHITVSDNGKGLSFDSKTLLKPYFSTKSKKDGSGLGLNIVEKIISDHGGVFDLIQNINQTGASCFFTLKY